MVDFIVLDLKSCYNNVFSCFDICILNKSTKNKEPVLIVFEEMDNIDINSDIQIYQDDWYINCSEGDKF